MRPVAPVRRASKRIKRRLSNLVPPIIRTDSDKPEVPKSVPEGAMSTPPPPPPHHAPNGGFRNPWPSAQVPTWTEIISGGNPLSWAHSNLHAHDKAKRIKVVRPDWGLALADPAPVTLLAPGAGPRLLATWLGHAAAFVQVPLARRTNKGKEAGVSVSEERVSVLFDPMFSARAGPTSYTGPSRINQLPCAVEDIPACEIVCISHNHYDHLDSYTIQSLHKRFPNIRYFVPLGNKAWFINCGIPDGQIHELDWWEDAELAPDALGLSRAPDDEENPRTSQIRITCVPAQHNSGRGATDQGKSLWSGWVVEHLVTAPPEPDSGPTTKRVTRRGSVFFAGDTGYRRSAGSDEVCPIFEELGTKFGPFDLSLIPIWRGGTLGFISWAGLRLSHEQTVSTFHGSPTDAVQIHLDVQSRNSIGIHFGTFVGSENESLEAVIELHEAAEDAGVAMLDEPGQPEKGRIGVIDIGETLAIEVEDMMIV